MLVKVTGQFLVDGTLEDVTSRAMKVWQTAAYIDNLLEDGAIHVIIQPVSEKTARYEAKHD